LLRWALHDTAATGDSASSPRSARIAAAHDVRGAVVLVHTTQGARLLACVLHGTRWWISVRAEALLALSAGERPARTVIARRMPPDAVTPALGAVTLRALVRAVHRWGRKQRVLRTAGATAVGGALSGAALNQAQRHAMTWLQRRVAALSTVERARRATYLQEAQAMIAGAASAGAAVALRAWMDEADADACESWPDWRVHPALSALVPPSACASVHSANAPVRVEVCLWVWPP